MKAVVLTGIGELIYKEVPDPVLNDNSFIIKVEACAICGSDIRSYHYGHPRIKYPHILGHEFSGTIIAVGKGIKEFKTGERVAVAPGIPCCECCICARGLYNMCKNRPVIGIDYPGAFAEKLLIPHKAIEAGCIVKLQDYVSFAEASLAEPLTACINGQEVLNISKGDIVVIIGAGPIGCLHAALAKIKGASKIILIDISDSRLKLANILSIDVLVNSKRDDAVKRVMKETNEEGASSVIVACCSAEAQRQALEMCGRKGRISFFAGLPKDNPYVTLNANLIHYKEIAIYGANGSTPKQYHLAQQLIAEHKIEVKKLISQYLPLEKIINGIEMIEKGEALKVILTP